MRIAKFIADAGYCSRREAEKLILEQRVSVNDAVITSPALNVIENSVVKVDGIRLIPNKKVRLWLYHKPRGVLTTHHDPEGRPIVFDQLHSTLPRVISVGRLDYNTEGLLLLTNNGQLARKLELPSTGLSRKYRCRVHGHLSKGDISSIESGLVVDGIQYRPLRLRIIEKTSPNYWIEMTIYEGKNREIRKILSYFGVEVSKLIRIEYGKFKLGDLKSGMLKELDFLDFKEYCE